MTFSATYRVSTLCALILLGFTTVIQSPQDPEIAFITHFGGTDAPTWVNAVAVDIDGNLILAGASNELYPATDTIEGSNHAGSTGNNALLVKIDGTTGEIFYSAFFGGSGLEEFRDIEIGPNGNYYLIGSTGSADFPTKNADQAELGGDHDGFLSVITPGGKLVLSTYIGGSARDWSDKVSVAANGTVAVAGITASTDFPTMGAFQGAFQGGQDAFFPKDVFLARYDAAGAKNYATYLGGSADERPCGIFLEDGGGITVGGHTGSTNFPLANAVQDAYAGGFGDFFATRLDGSGTTLVFSTYFGGSDEEFCADFAMNAAGDAILAGQTRSDDYPIVDGPAFDPADAADGVLLNLDGAGQAMYSVRSKVAGDDQFAAFDLDDEDAPVVMSRASEAGAISVFEKQDGSDLAPIFSFDSPGSRPGSIEVVGSDLFWGGTFFPGAANAKNQFVAKSQGEGGSILRLSGSFEGAVADLSVAKLHELIPGAIPDVEHYPYGTPIKFVLTIKNNGPNASPQTVVEDILDSPVPVTISEAKITVKGQETPCVIAGNKVTCQAGTLEVAEIAFAEITVAGIQDPGDNIKVTNTATVSGALSDNNSINNEASIDIEFVGATTLEVTITPPENPAVGVLASWTITVKNIGVRDAYGVVEFVSSLAAINGEGVGPALDQIRGRSEMGSCDPFVCKLSVLAADAEWTIRYQGFPTVLSGPFFTVFFVNILFAEARALNAPKADAESVEIGTRPGLMRLQGALGEASGGKNSAGEIDVYVDGFLVLDNLTPGTASGLVEFEAGRTSPVVEVVDGSESTNENPISTFLVDFLATTPGDSLLSASATLVFVPSGDTLAVAVLPNSRDSSAVPGMVDLAVVHVADTSLTLRAEIRETTEGSALVATLSNSLIPLGSSIHVTVAPGEYVVEFTDESGNNESFLIDLSNMADNALVGIVSLGTSGKNDAAIGLVLSLFDGQGNPVAAPVSTASERVAELPNKFDLLPAYPNPFNPSTTIIYELSERARVRIDVFDAVGRLVGTLVNADVAAGRYDASWNARTDAGLEMPSGIYIVRMSVGAFTQSRTVTLLR